jgi:choline kinase
MLSKRPTHAVILSAGQGRRLLPLTAEIPKCLLPVEGDRPILALQLEALAECGVSSATVLVGFGAAHVEGWLARRGRADVAVRTRYNPFYAVSDNLATCWLAGADMQSDFVLLNGDTLFHPDVLRRALAESRGPVTLTVDRKPVYDADDMKVTLNGGRRLVNVGKGIPAGQAHGEAIGLTVFRGTGCHAFRHGLDVAMRDPRALGRWYLDVIDALAGTIPVQCVSIEGLWWCEIDTPVDLAGARAVLRRAANERAAAAAVARVPQAARA